MDGFAELLAVAAPASRKDVEITSISSFSTATTLPLPASYPVNAAKGRGTPGHHRPHPSPPSLASSHSSSRFSTSFVGNASFSSLPTTFKRANFAVLGYSDSGNSAEFTNVYKASGRMKPLAPEKQVPLQPLKKSKKQSPKQQAASNASMHVEVQPDLANSQMSIVNLPGLGTVMMAPVDVDPTLAVSQRVPSTGEVKLKRQEPSSPRPPIACAPQVSPLRKRSSIDSIGSAEDRIVSPPACTTLPQYLDLDCDNTSPLRVNDLETASPVLSRDAAKDSSFPASGATSAIAAVTPSRDVPLVHAELQNSHEDNEQLQSLEATQITPNVKKDKRKRRHSRKDKSTIAGTGDEKAEELSSPEKEVEKDSVMDAKVPVAHLPELTSTPNITKADDPDAIAKLNRKERRKLRRLSGVKDVGEVTDNKVVSTQAKAATTDMSLPASVKQTQAPTVTNSKNVFSSPGQGAGSQIRSRATLVADIPKRPQSTHVLSKPAPSAQSQADHVKQSAPRIATTTLKTPSSSPATATVHPAVAELLRMMG